MARACDSKRGELCGKEVDGKGGTGEGEDMMTYESMVVQSEVWCQRKMTFGGGSESIIP